jgi:hypothetical protein
VPGVSALCNQKLAFTIVQDTSTSEIELSTCLKSRTDKLAVKLLMAVKMTCCLYVLAPLAPLKGPVITAPNAFAATCLANISSRTDQADYAAEYIQVARSTRMIFKISPVDSLCLVAIAVPKFLLRTVQVQQLRRLKRKKGVPAYQRLESPCGQTNPDGCCILSFLGMLTNSGLL